MDLLVPAYLKHQSYRVPPRASAMASNVREWIRGEQLLLAMLEPTPGPGTWFASPLGVHDVTAFVQFMPEDRAKRVARAYFEQDDRQFEQETGNDH